MPGVFTSGSRNVIEHPEPAGTHYHRPQGIVVRPRQSGSGGQLQDVPALRQRTRAGDVILEFHHTHHARMMTDPTGVLS